MNEALRQRIRRLLIATSILVFVLAGSAMAAGSSTRTMTRSYNGSKYTYQDVTGKVSYQTYVYHKLVVPVDGVLTVSGKTQEDKGIRITLCDGSKNPIDVNSYNFVSTVSKYYAYYGVKKGVYYIRTQAYKVGRGKRYVVAAVLTPQTDQSGTAASPKVMVRGTKYTDVFPAGESAGGSSYFKLYANGTNPVKLKIANITGQGYFTAVISGPSWPNGSTQKLAAKATTSLTLQRVNTRTGAKTGPIAGWYYIRITKRQDHSSSVDYRKSNGLFQLAWAY